MSLEIAEKIKILQNDIDLLKNNIDLKEIHTNHSVKDIVEELIRYDSPLQFFQRWVLEDTEIEGVKVKKHTKVAILLGSANRDDRAFEEADKINFDRETFNHTSFGGGVHYCLGAHLARLELEVSFNNLLSENIELVSNPERTGAFGIRGYQGIKVKI